MDAITPRDVDLNLLLVFDAMLEHRNVTRAGEALNLSQPAMSAAVARLRKVFDDALFVKVGVRMEPTARAQALAETVHAVVETVRTQILRPAAFDPATSAQEFTLVTPDIGEIQFLPALFAVLERDAPGVRLRAVSRTPEHAGEALARGGADLALGYFPDLKGAGFFQQKLFDNPLVCLVREGHPKLTRGQLKERDYLAARHVVVRPDGREHVFESHLHRRDVSRNVVLEVAHFMSVLPIIEATDLVATVPRDLARTCERYAKVVVVDSPIPAPSVPIHQFWHRRTHEDAASKWLRAQVVQLFGAGGTGRGAGARR